MKIARPWLLVVVAASLGLPATAFAHATLTHAEPASGSTLASCPSQVRLVFSEALEPTLTRLALDGTVKASALDPHDVHAAIAPLECLAPGAHTVTWSVVSADGHKVQGTYRFTIAGVAPDSALVAPTSAPPVVTLDSVVPKRDSVVAVPATEVPALAAFLRGAALVALMSFAGLLFFRDKRLPVRFSQGETMLAIAVPLLIAAHHAAWMVSVDDAHTLSFTTASLKTMQAHIELWRLGLSVMALWALVLARRRSLAAIFAMAAVAAGGAMGHPAAIHPEGTIAAKALHLVAGAVWLGGLLHLVTLGRSDRGAFERQASRVSTWALGSVVVILLSGVIQWRYFLPTFALTHSTYGIVLLAKITGMLLLLALGAHHRYRVLPKLRASGGFGASLRAEIALMVLVAMLGGLLAYTSIPVAP
ncbi:MAG: copper resistance protein CopC [Gemmatimonadaceae bacterium]